MSDRRSYIREIANSISDREQRAQRIFFAEQAFALLKNGGAEFDIKQSISHHYQCDFRSVVFCGSAHLGFSPTKDTDFRPGDSDLDVAIIDHNLFQAVWRDAVNATRAFNDLSVFGSEPNATRRVTEFRDMMFKRGLIHAHNLPRGEPFDQDRRFIDRLSARYTRLFKTISISFYMNEYAFAWKQDSSIQHIIRA